MTRSDGKKFSKSEGTAIWLTADRTSPYAFYQYWLNVADADAVRFLKIYTLLAREEIEALAAAQQAAPQERAAQRALAQRAHRATARRARSCAARSSRARRCSGAATCAPSMRRRSRRSSRTCRTPWSRARRSEGEGVALVDLLPRTTLASSKREAREFLRSGAVSVNGRRAGEADRLSRAATCSTAAPCCCAAARRPGTRCSGGRKTPAPGGAGAHSA